MPPPLGMPPSGPPPMGPPPGGPPDAKRQRTGGLVLEPEEEFLAKYPGPSKVTSLCMLSLQCKTRKLSVVEQLGFPCGITTLSFILHGA